MKTKDLQGDQLDWAVGIAAKESLTVRERFPRVLNSSGRWNPGSNWSQGGPLIEQEGIELKRGMTKPLLWAAWTFQWNGLRLASSGMTGSTPLVAAMRSYVASKLGNEVDVPECLSASQD